MDDIICQMMRGDNGIDERRRVVPSQLVGKETLHCGVVPQCNIYRLPYISFNIHKVKFE